MKIAAGSFTLLTNLVSHDQLLIVVSSQTSAGAKDVGGRQTWHTYLPITFEHLRTHDLELIVDMLSFLASHHGLFRIVKVCIPRVAAFSVLKAAKARF